MECSLLPCRRITGNSVCCHTDLTTVGLYIHVAQRSGPETTVCLEFGAAEVQGEAQCAPNINV